MIKNSEFFHALQPLIMITIKIKAFYCEASCAGSVQTILGSISFYLCIYIMRARRAGPWFMAPCKVLFHTQHSFQDFKIYYIWYFARNELLSSWNIILQAFVHKLNATYRNCNCCLNLFIKSFTVFVMNVSRLP